MIVLCVYVCVATLLLHSVAAASDADPDHVVVSFSSLSLFLFLSFPSSSFVFFISEFYNNTFRKILLHNHAYNTRWRFRALVLAGCAHCCITLSHALRHLPSQQIALMRIHCKTSFLHRPAFARRRLPRSHCRRRLAAMMAKRCQRRCCGAA